MWERMSAPSRFLPNMPVKAEMMTLGLAKKAVIEEVQTEHGDAGPEEPAGEDIAEAEC